MSIYKNILQAQKQNRKLLSILIDPDKFEVDYAFAKEYLNKLPSSTTHLFIGGSTDKEGKTEAVVKLLKGVTTLPIILFPGNYDQVTPEAQGLLFLSLLSGDNPEYLINQQRKAARKVQQSNLEVIPTGYVLIDGGTETAVQRVSNTVPLPQENLEKIIATALAAQYLGKKMLYLEAGSGAKIAVHTTIINAVCKAIDIPVIVGGGIIFEKQLEEAYIAGATMVVIGTAFENDSWQS